MMAYPNRSHRISEGENTSLHLYDLLTTYLEAHMPPAAAAVITALPAARARSSAGRRDHHEDARTGIGRSGVAAGGGGHGRDGEERRSQAPASTVGGEGRTLPPSRPRDEVVRAGAEAEDRGGPVIRACRTRGPAPRGRCRAPLFDLVEAPGRDEAVAVVPAGSPRPREDARARDQLETIGPLTER